MGNEDWDKVTQDECDLLADMIWWLRGYLRAKEEEHNPTYFQQHHVDVLRKAMYKFKNDMMEEK